MSADLKLPGAPEYEWWCSRCWCVVPPGAVTYQEFHDPREGGCGYMVTSRPRQMSEAPARESMGLSENLIVQPVAEGQRSREGAGDGYPSDFEALLERHKATEATLSAQQAELARARDAQGVSARSSQHNADVATGAIARELLQENRADVALAQVAAQQETIRQWQNAMRVLLYVAIRDGHLTREAVNLLIVHHVRKAAGKEPIFCDEGLAAEVEVWAEGALQDPGTGGPMRRDDDFRWFVPRRRWTRRVCMTPVLLVGAVPYAVAGLGIGLLLGLRSWWVELREVWR